MQPIKLVAVYGRVSTSLQENEGTIETQLSAVRDFAEKNHLKIVTEYVDEGWSGDNLVRPNLDQLRMDAKKKLWDAVLIYDPDRLARRSAWQEVVIEELKELGIEVLFVTVPPPKTDEDQIMLKMRGVFAEYERMKIKERFRLGKVRKVREGYILTTEALYGYKYVPTVKVPNQPKVHGYYEINEEEAKVVRMIFHWVADDGLTLRAIVRKLQAMGIKPRKSKRGVWATSTLTTMLRHEGYTGEAHWGKTYAVVAENPLKTEKYRKQKKTSRKDRPKDDWYTIPIPSIIGKDLFLRARRRIEANFALSKRNKKNDYLLSGIIWCPCGRRLCGCSPLGGKHLYYRCNNRVNNFPLPATCSEKGLNARVSDSMIWDKMVELMSSPDLLHQQVDRWLNSRVTKVNASQGSVEDLERDIEKLHVQEERYSKAYGAGLIDLEQLKSYITPLKQRVEAIRLQISSLREERDGVESASIPTSQEVEAFTEEVVKHLPYLNFALKREIVLSTIDKVVGTQKELQVYGNIPLSNVSFFSIHRYCRFAERGEVHAL